MSTTLCGLPPKLANNVCTFLPRDDLLSLRLVCRHFSKIVVTELSKSLASEDKLKKLVVLYTESGLKVLKGLCEIAEFRKQIEQVALILPRVPGDYFINDYLEVCSSKQESFIASEKLRSLLRDIVSLLNNAEKLTDIVIDHNPDSYEGPLCGSESLLTGLQLTQDIVANNCRRMAAGHGDYMRKLPVQGCDACKNFFRALNNTSFPNLTEVNFSNHVIDGEALAQFLHSYSHQLRSIKLEFCALSTGSWKTIFKLLIDMPLLTKLRLAFLSELNPRCCPDAVRPALMVPHENSWTDVAFLRGPEDSESDDSSDSDTSDGDWWLAFDDDDNYPIAIPAGDSESGNDDENDADENNADDDMPHASNPEPELAEEVDTSPKEEGNELENEEDDEDGE
ncbi:hypothetical protein BU23DRAFT_567731 [Bimuria novae-zelandiae CBS 107.79]|uniref:F-box domain-containing protein n=1 Tax=Bimuria novae-zelandiae CBS 107.79 TaxID=1447943 RepID=A0A6A5VD04_9PLEO|nr:hypothetical protein BU23DRAFT_567731 [Bimuria novae-zelandiae CBS 107.79]